MRNGQRAWAGWRRRVSCQCDARADSRTPALQHVRRRSSSSIRALEDYASRPVQPVTLRQLVFFGRNINETKLIKSANYVRRELPVRIAHRIRDFQTNLPYIVGTNPHLARVYQLYWDAFDRLREVKDIQTLADNDGFCETLKSLLQDHLVVIPKLAIGVTECTGLVDSHFLDAFMTRMLRGRISRRTLAEQHIALSEGLEEAFSSSALDDSHVGIVYNNLSARGTIERCASLCRETFERGDNPFLESIHATVTRQSNAVPSEKPLVERKKGLIALPDIVINGHLDVTLAAIPEHLEYILFELLKNALEATVHQHKQSVSTSEASGLPSITVSIASSAQDVLFRISDQGGGIPAPIAQDTQALSQGTTRNLFSFAHRRRLDDQADASGRKSHDALRHVKRFGATVEEQANLLDVIGTARRSALNADGLERETSTLRREVQPLKSELAERPHHLGIGLPMAHIFATYFGGDLSLHSLDGYGCDAYLRMARLGNVQEALK